MSQFASAAAAAIGKSAAKNGTRTAIVWFRHTDLRLHDHEPLFLAHKNHDRVVHFFCFDDRFHGTSTVDYSNSMPPTGWPKTGRFRAQFLLESVQDLHNNLAAVRNGNQDPQQ